MNDTITMMFSVLIVMFGYLVFKILTDQSQSTPTSTRKRSKKKGTGKPSKYPLDTIALNQGATGGAHTLLRRAQNSETCKFKI